MPDAQDPREEGPPEDSGRWGGDDPRAPRGGEAGAADDPGESAEAPAAGDLEEELAGLGEPGDEDDYEDDEEEDAEDVESVTIEITGLSLYTHHGASAAEREVGQRLVLDLRLDLGGSDATATDRVEDTVDYAEVCQLVALVAQQRSHHTLERLCATIAERLLSDYELEGVWVKATKPEPPIPLSVEGVSVEVWREAQ
ncbi:MAG: dihydroneopterin aldolase [Solirubrobacteraceae bacterium]